MSYDNSANAVRRLEERFERLLLILGDMQSAIGRLQQPSYSSGGQSGGGGGLVYSIAPTVIPAATGSPSSPPSGTPGNLASQTVYALVGGAFVALPGTYTIYNQMAAATVSTTGKTIIVGANPDGTFTVITQSC